jgi:DNA-binding transcriptional regulator YhcF (GntR family)
MKDKTKVKAKNVWKVAEVLVSDPNATQREIAKKTGVARNTVIKAKEELSQNWTKDPTIAYIVGSSKDRLKKVQAVFDRYLDESIEKVKLERGDLWLIKDIAKDDLQRITVLWWTITDAEWWLRDLSNLSILELESQRRLLLGE